MKEMEKLEFVFEVIETETPKMDNAAVEVGCWGDTGSDANNMC